MNSNEKKVVKGFMRDMSHDIKEYQNHLDGKGGLTWDGFKYRLERKLHEMKLLTEDTYFVTYGVPKDDS